MGAQEYRQCSVSDCTERHQAKGYCNVHYFRVRRGGDLNAKYIKPQTARLCSIDGCDRPHNSKGLCRPHYARHTLGIPMDKPILIRKPRTEGNSTGWRIDDGYVIRNVTINGKTKFQRQHRLVMEQKIGRPLLKHETVHHRNGDRADNRIENLELWSHSQPYGQRIEDKADWAVEILRLYRPSVLK